MTNMDAVRMAIETAREKGLELGRIPDPSGEWHRFKFWKISEPFPELFVESSFSWKPEWLSKNDAELRIRNQIAGAIISLNNTEREGMESGKPQNCGAV